MSWEIDTPCQGTGSNEDLQNHKNSSDFLTDFSILLVYFQTTQHKPYVLNEIETTQDNETDLKIYYTISN